jgi:phosphoenolpyruvate carboxylase
MQTSIPKELQSLVFWAIELLGKNIQNQYGKDVYIEIEKIRKKMKSIRAADISETLKVLKSTQKQISKNDNKRLQQIAHSFSLMLELINRCESAYRTYRLDQREDKVFKEKPHAIIFVFTAHPTEARSPELLFIFGQIYYKLIDALENGKYKTQEDLSYLLSMALTAPIARSSKPSVEDEAKSLYSYVLRNEILSQQIEFYKKGITVNFRSWVGGDKDGHPGVNEKTLHMSLVLSRDKLLDWIDCRLMQTRDELDLLTLKSDGIKKSFNKVLEESQKLRVINDGDGFKVVKFKKDIDKLIEKHYQLTKVRAPGLSNISHLIWLYPALVLPLEVREDSELVHLALKDKNLTIYKMLDLLKRISKGHDPKWYVRGFVLSMANSADDITSGYKLAKKTLGSYSIPVVPLFETSNALNNATEILTKYFNDNPQVKKDHTNNWSKRFEIMLGYSDSSKESGVFPSRFQISNALVKIDKFFDKNKLVPIFFHGSGGSIERGGGSIKEQTQWWPKSAVNTFKATTQGEMIARNFAGGQIMQSQVEKIVEQLSYSNPKVNAEHSKILNKFSKKIQENYQATVSTEEFYEKILMATPYNYLSALKIGSRPSKRQTAGRRLRAIPWVLCWTQSRVLFPTWWGVGSAYEALDPKEQEAMKSIYTKNNLLGSFIKSLGFTLRKVELPIWKLYLERLDLSKNEIEGLFSVFCEEYELTLKFINAITGESNLLWFRHWLGQSIYFRSSMIHPLNLIQIEALKRNNEELLRETVTGIACGMMTTG